MNEAARNLLNTAVDLVNRNRLAQAALVSGGAYAGSRIFNALSPVDIDPEAAATAGFFMGPMIYKKVHGMGSQWQKASDAYEQMYPGDPANKRRAAMNMLNISVGQPMEMK